MALVEYKRQFCFQCGNDSPRGEQSVNQMHLLTLHYIPEQGKLQKCMLILS